VVDEVETTGSPAQRMAFHLGPTIGVHLEDHDAVLTWPTSEGVGSATLTLPSGLEWTAHRAEVNRCSAGTRNASV
jgi:hypothetical protein